MNLCLVVLVWSITSPDTGDTAEPQQHTEFSPPLPTRNGQQRRLGHPWCDTAPWRQQEVTPRINGVNPATLSRDDRVGAQESAMRFLGVEERNAETPFFDSIIQLP